MSISPCSVRKEESLDSYGNVLISNALGLHILSFLDFKDLAQAEGVCRRWKLVIATTDQWKKQCQYRLNISEDLDPRRFLPNGCTPDKRGAQLASTKVYDAKIYRDILGADIEFGPQILKAQSLEKSNEPDPCDPHKTKGQSYVWLDSPAYFCIPVNKRFLFKLNKEDNSDDEEAPRLIPLSLTERFQRKIIPTSNETLKVPNTINNLEVLFKHHLKKGNPSTYFHGQNTAHTMHVNDCEDVFVQHGDKRIRSGRICMREDVIGRDMDFDRQRAAAVEAGVKISCLGHRILFNFLRHAETNAYQDGEKSSAFARTSTVTVGPRDGFDSPSGCGFEAPSSLAIGLILSCDDNIGVAVALPAEE